MDILNDFIPQYTYASFTKRYVGVVIDYVIYCVIWIVFVRSFGVEETYADGTTNFEVTGLMAFLIITIPWIILRPLIEAINDGQSIGKAIVGIRVLKMDGTKASFGNIIVRHLFDGIDVLPFLGILGLLVASGNPQRQRIGDQVAKTIVVNARNR